MIFKRYQSLINPSRVDKRIDKPVSFRLKRMGNSKNTNLITFTEFLAKALHQIVVRNLLDKHSFYDHQ